MPLREFTPAELLLSERRRMDRPLCMTVWVGTAAFCIACGGWFYLLAVSLAVVLNLAAVRRGREVHVQRLFINIAVVASTGVLIIELRSGQAEVLQAIGHFLILLQVCKLFERKGNRDYTQILALSGLQMVAGSLLSNSLPFTLLLLIYLVLLGHTAMVFTLKRGLDAAASAVLPGETRPPDIQQVAWNVARSWPAGALRWRLAGILPAAIAVGVATFLLAPRNDSATGALGSDGSSAVSGYDSEVRLGDVAGPVYQSNEVLMHVRVALPRGTAASEALYLRGATFEAYQGSRWDSMERHRGWEHAADLPLAPPALHAQAGTLEVMMVSSLLPHLFTAYPTIEVESEQGMPGREADLTYRLLVRDAAPRRVEYTARFLGEPLSPEARAYVQKLRRLSGPLSAVEPSRTVAVADSVRRLARQWCADLLDRRGEDNRDEIDLLIAQRIAERLKERCTYTLDLSAVDSSRDGVEDFLFHTHSGHCEYFASAMTVMCRLLDVRARLATGFLMGEYDAGQGYYVVRGRNAHAWTEVFTPGSDWVVVDATPPGGRAVHGQVWGASVRRFFSDLQFMWYDRVIGYNEESRQKVTAWVARYAHFARDELQKAAVRLGESLRNLLIHGVVDRLLVFVALGVGAMGLVLEGLLAYRGVRRGIRRRREALGPLPVPTRRMKFMLDLLSLLARHGVRRRAEQTPRELARRAHRQLGLSETVLAELIDLYYATRCGRPAAQRRAAPPRPAAGGCAERR